MSIQKIRKLYGKIIDEICLMSLFDPRLKRWFKRADNINNIIKRCEAAIPRHT